MKWGKKLKVAFDAQLLLKGEKTGIGWCAENILQKLIEYNEHDYQLNYFTLGYNTKQLENAKKYSQKGYDINDCNWFHDVIYRMLWNFVAVPYSLFFGKKADVTIFFNYVIPPGVKGKKITFVYDMGYKAYPETVRRKTRSLLNIALSKSCKRADQIITISEFSKSEIIKYLGIPENKISIMPCGVDSSLYHPNYSDEEVRTIMDKYQIKGDYLLYLGTLEPRKNVVRLIQAYAQLKKKIPNIPELVLAGRKGWMFDSIFDIVKNLNMDKCIIFTGYVDEKDAPILIKGAEVFLFPSIYEGFGMPPLEAMACGTPVLVSNVSSLPEVVGDAGFLVDPFSVDSIKEGIEILIKDEGKRNELSKLGMERVKLYTWDNAAKIIHTIIRDLR